MTVTVSFEVFPPKTPAGLDDLATVVRRMCAVEPAYVSVTYGAGGSDRGRSYDAIRTAVDACASIAGHLTCVGQPVDEIEAVMDEYQALNVRHIVALRGDPPGGVDAPYSAHPQGFQRTADLVDAARRRGFEVSVSAYPERHPQSPSDDHDLDVLTEKVAAGASRATTQMFFDNAHFVRYVDRVRRRGIDVPIVPGIFPIHSFPAVSRFAAKCGATIPARVAERFEQFGDDPTGAFETAADVAAEQVAELEAFGVEQVHLYTLNRAELALAVCARLGIETRSEVAAS